MQLRVLGPVDAASHGRRVSFASERQRTILAALLAARGEVVSSGRLIDGIWGQHPPSSAPKTLQSHVSKLRRTLTSLGRAGDAVIATVTEGYRIDLATCEVDVERFEELVAEARREGRAPRDAVDLLSDAEALWRGPAFGELAAHELVQVEARRLELLRRSATADRIDGQLASGRHRDALGELEALIEQDPLDERAHGQVMTALYLDGRQADALAVFRGLRDRLAEEVGVDPSTGLQRLHERILRQDPDLAVTPSPPHHRTPATDKVDRELIGREQDLEAVADLVGATPLVTLIGPGGVGKTRLAEQVATQTADTFPEHVVIARLASVHDPASVAPALLDALEAGHQGGRPADETVLAALGTRRLLLLLDNCEHVVEAVAPLADAIVRACPNVALLATSREPLRVPGERVWQVAPLAVPPADATTDEVLSAPAGALFVTRARAAEPRFTLTDVDAAAVGELCRRLDGIPLALELAASRVRAMSPRELCDRLGQRFDLLTGGPHHDAGRHRTLQAVVRWSYDALDDPQRRLFDRLAVFAGRFTLAAAEEVCAGAPLAREDIAGRLAELVDRCLVTVDRDGEQTRYRLLDTLRAFGSLRLEESGEAERSRQAHAIYHVAFAERQGPQVRGDRERLAVSQIDEAIDDLRVAHAWLVLAGDVDGALRLPAALRDYIGHRQHDEMTTWTERALDLPGAADHPTYAAALATAARGATRRGDLVRGRRYGEEALARAEPTSTAASWAVHALASAALYEGRLDDVLALTERRVPVDDPTGEDYYQAMASSLRVLAYQYRGDLRSAATAADQLRAAAEASENESMLAWARYCQGEVRLEADPKAARTFLEEAIAIARRTEARIPEGVAMVSLASLHSRTGETDRAVELFAEVVAHWRRLGDWTHQLTTLRNLVDLLVRRGADEPAAVVHAAVSDATPPSFGLEAERLAAAWDEVERRLGPERAAAATERGRGLGPAELVDEALTTLDGLRGN
jgi:predicted ATPase/DNA-binding SARP family transcriptional activator